MDFPAHLLAFPPEKKLSGKEFDKQASEFARELAKVPPPTWLKPVNKQNILDLLNPAVNSLPYLFALYAQAQAASKDQSLLDGVVTRLVVFFTSFHPVQVRYAGETWRSLLEWSFDLFPRIGVLDFTPLSTAMLRLDPTAGTFTSTHLRFLRLCAECGVPSQALPILDKNIYAYPQATPKNVLEDLPCDIPADDLSNTFLTPNSGFTSWPLRSEYILEYYLLGAHVYLGLRSYARARLFLECVLLFPSLSHTCSAFQVEAYKKYLLLGLLAQGKGFGLPRTHDVQVVKAIRATSRAYEALVEDFEKRDWRKFEAEVDSGANIWTEDGNLRMVMECSLALVRCRVTDLQKTYAALPVSRVAHHLSMPTEQTFELLEDIISQNYLSATITPSSSSTAVGDAVLQFNPSLDQQKASLLDLEGQTKRIESLVAFIRDADRRLQLSKEYVEHQKRSKRGMAGPDGDLADHMDLTWDPPIAGLGNDEEGSGDEDIMAS